MCGCDRQTANLIAGETTIAATAARTDVLHDAPVVGHVFFAFLLHQHRAMMHFAAARLPECPLVGSFTTGWLADFAAFVARPQRAEVFAAAIVHGYDHGVHLADEPADRLQTAMLAATHAASLLIAAGQSWVRQGEPRQGCQEKSHTVPSCQSLGHRYYFGKFPRRRITRLDRAEK